MSSSNSSPRFLRCLGPGHAGTGKPPALQAGADECCRFSGDGPIPAPPPALPVVKPAPEPELEPEPEPEPMAVAPIPVVGWLLDVGYRCLRDPANDLFARAAIENSLVDKLSVIGMHGIAPGVDGEDGKTAFIAYVLLNCKGNELFVTGGRTRGLADRQRKRLRHRGQRPRPDS